MSSESPALWVFVLVVVVAEFWGTTSGTYIIAFSYAEAAKGSLGMEEIN